MQHQTPKHAGAQFLASNWVLQHPGPNGLALAVQAWLKAHVDKVDPAIAWSPGAQTKKDAAKLVSSATLKRPAANRARAMKRRR